MDKWKLIIDHIFKFRIGDTDEKGGCTFIGGEWKDVSTKELFGDKKVVIFSYQVLLHQLVLVNNYLHMTKCILNLKTKELMMYIAYL